MTGDQFKTALVELGFGGRHGCRDAGAFFDVNPATVWRWQRGGPSVLVAYLVILMRHYEVSVADMKMLREGWGVRLTKAGRKERRVMSDLELLARARALLDGGPV